MKEICTMSNPQPVTAADVEAVRQQLHAVDDQIGGVTVDWRRAAADPGAAAHAAERLQVLERQRDLLREALAGAERELAAIEAQGNEERVHALIETVRREAMPLLDAREAMGRELEAAVLRVAELIEGLHEQAQEVRRCWPADAARVSGVNSLHASCFHGLDSANLHASVNQMLAWRLGRLWPEERALANRDESVAHRIVMEVNPIRYAFEEGVKQVAPTLQLTTHGEHDEGEVPNEGERGRRPRAVGRRDPAHRGPAQGHDAAPGAHRRRLASPEL
jgi:hypothetical protein